MSRTTLNAIVDAVAYTGIVVLATTGLMLSNAAGERWIARYSGAGAASRPVTVVWGLSRHEWGSVHYWVALVLMGVLAAHLLLHWKWIVCVLRGKPHTDVSGGRFAVGIAGLVLVTLLASAPLLTPSQTTPRSELLERSSGVTHGEIGDANAEKKSSDAETIRGFMTLEEVARQSELPVSGLLERLDLPRDTAPSEQVGRLLRAHGLDMSDLRKAVGHDEPAE